MNEQLWIEPVGQIIVSRVRGTPTEDLLRDAQERILNLVKETGNGKILYDCLELTAPAVQVPMSQWKLDLEIAPMKLRRAIVVPNTQLAYLARLAFVEGEHRVFYNDLAAAVQWLSED